MSSDSATTPPPVRTDRVRVIALMAKKDDISDADFYKYWHEVHGPLFANLEITKKNLLKYEQAFSSQHHYNHAFDAGILAIGAATTSTFKGMAVFEAESYEKIFQVIGSDEYSSVVGPADEANFMDRSKTVFMPGTLISFINKN
ncbi:hypothetical protein C8Q80DRAFT_1124814 [Daedaleopsis nitida]|nr:hypothetical protein C8Q80DRAFT_1124814 [Daedaleopsis nitida]